MEADGDGRCLEDGRVAKTGGVPVVSAVNAQHAVFADHTNIWIYSLTAPSSLPRRVCHGASKAYGVLTIAISSALRSILALARGHQTLIINPYSGKTIATLRGNGHNITAICFSHHDPDIVATGTADGSVNVWSVHSPLQPMSSLRGTGRACQNLAFSPIKRHELAIECTGDVLIWDTQSARPVATSVTSGRNTQTLLWSNNDASLLIFVTQSGFLSVWSLQGTETDTKHSDSDTYHGGIPKAQAEQNGHSLQSSCLLTFDFGQPTLQLEFIGRRCLAVLLEEGRTILFYRISTDFSTLSEIWRLNTSSTIYAICLQIQAPFNYLYAHGPSGMKRFDVPSSICDDLERDAGQHWLAKPSDAPQDANGLTKRSMSMMIPEHIEHYARKQPYYSRSRRASPSKSPRGHSGVNGTATRPSTARSLAQSEQSAFSEITSTLELPSIHARDQGPLMPFLSPSIPASRDLSATITPLDESLHLPPLARASFDSTNTAAGNDSDSDDEALSGPLVSSGTLLPGGVNVPLPRTCGALFTPSGHLVTFLPMKPRPASAAEEIEPPDPIRNESQELEVIKLFPTFGNLARVPLPRDSSSSDSESVASADIPYAGPQHFGLQHSSYDSRHNWNLKVSPTKTKTSMLPDETNVKICVYNIDAYSMLRRDVAEQYKLFSVGDESYSHICHSNADIATAANLHEAADAWTTLALSFQLHTTQELKAAKIRENDWSTSSRPGEFPFEHPNQSNYAPTVSRHQFDIITQFQPDNQPLGNAWAIRKLFTWAERRGDVQMLAQISLFVLSASRYNARKRIEGESVTLHSAHYPSEAEANGTQATRTNRSSSTIPLLRANSSDTGRTTSFPARGQFSRTSSRNPSQPSTPYLEHALGTPPLVFPTISRSTSKLSATGSASPEHNRNSFSAAAKYYAQSITDRFSSYGSSPPTKKTGTSPSLELSSSLPTTTGSWSKSVSFASTENTAGGSRRGLGIANDDGDYDSDKTIDDSSHPQTPKGQNTGVLIRWKSPPKTHDNASNSQPTELTFSDIFRSNSQIWCGYYAERLRSWGLMFRASELEKAVGVATRALSHDGKDEQDVRPGPVGRRSETVCTICYCIIRAAQQLCPACGHTTHPSCLEDYLGTLAEADFTCPAGCGCDCTSAHERLFVDAATVPSNQTSSGAVKAKNIRRRPSLTDPRRARARLEGESW